MLDLAAYFDRIGYSGPREPTLATLTALHAAHVDAIPFEAFNVLTGRGVDLSLPALEAKLVAGRRGGYCFEQNSLFLAVLSALGFVAEPLLARVLWMRPPEAPPGPRTHMVLRVVIAGEPWLADVGFGGVALPTPIRFDVDGPQATTHEPYRLAAVPFGQRLEIDLAGEGWTKVYEISHAPQVAADIEAGNWWTSAHPGSQFRSRLLVSRTAPAARYTLLGPRFTARPRDGEMTRQVLDAEGLERVLGEVFGLKAEPAWRPVRERVAAAGDGV